MDGKSLREEVRLAIAEDGRKLRIEQEQHEQARSPEFKAARSAAHRLMEALMKEANAALAELPDNPDATSGSNDQKTWFAWYGNARHEPIKGYIEVKFDREHLQLYAFVQCPDEDSIVRHMQYAADQRFRVEDEAIALEWLKESFIRCCVAYRRKVLLTA